MPDAIAPIRIVIADDIIVALRPTAPQLPFGLPDSNRLLAPTLAEGVLIPSFDPLTGNPTAVANLSYNFRRE